jgi:hypothetical protein
MIALPRYQLYLRHASHHLGPHQRCHTRYPVHTIETTSPSHRRFPHHQLYFALSIYLETLSLPFTYFLQPAPHPCPPRPIRTLNRFIALTQPRPHSPGISVPTDLAAQRRCIAPPSQLDKINPLSFCTFTSYIHSFPISYEHVRFHPYTYTYKPAPSH